MSLEAWGDEGNVPENGRDTAMYQDLIAVRTRFEKWMKDRKNDPLGSPEQEAFAERIDVAVNELLDLLAE